MKGKLNLHPFPFPLPPSSFFTSPYPRSRFEHHVEREIARLWSADFHAGSMRSSCFHPCLVLNNNRSLPPAPVKLWLTPASLTPVRGELHSGSSLALSDRQAHEKSTRTKQSPGHQRSQHRPKTSDLLGDLRSYHCVPLLGPGCSDASRSGDFADVLVKSGCRYAGTDRP